MKKRGQEPFLCRWSAGPKAPNFMLGVMTCAAVIFLLPGLCNPTHALQKDTAPDQPQAVNIPSGDTIAIPPDVLQQIRNRTGAVFMPGQPITTLSGSARVLLAVAAAVILAGGVFAARFLTAAVRRVISEPVDGVVFGLFGAVAALIAACACTGRLYLHLAAMLCTAGAGFLVTMLVFINLKGFISRSTNPRPPGLIKEPSHDGAVE
jgi:hypothetical protein